jgi:hypothetical protein
VHQIFSKFVGLFSTSNKPYVMIITHIIEAIGAYEMLKFLDFRSRVGREKWVSM